MKTIKAEQIQQAVRDLFLEAGLCPPAEVVCALREAHKTEASPQGREVLSQLVENARIAKRDRIPYCQDTGMAVVFLDVGQDIHIEGSLAKAVNDGVREAYDKGYMRKSVLTALSRKNTGDNTPAVIHTTLVEGDTLTITALPKGFGSENMSRIKMFPPSAGMEGIKAFIVDTAKIASANPCPPVVLGVGIGGTFELAAIMSKRQLARPLGQPNADPVLREMEQDIKDRINALGMGPMGLGGTHYCLAVHIMEYPTHIAGLPVAVNYCCHAARHATCTL